MGVICAAPTAGSAGVDAPTLPGPFAVLPGGDQVVLHVPASKGLLLLQGSRIVRHIPLPSAFPVQSLDASSRFIVAGARPLAGRITIALRIFDPADGKLLARVESANPFLRMSADSSKGWRVVAGASRAGIFHPPTAATYPLWDLTDGVVASADQIGRAQAGIGFEGPNRWVPQPDGSVGRRDPGRTIPVLEAGHGAFIGGLSNGTVLVRGEDSAESAVVLAFRNGQAIGEIRLRVAPPRAARDPHDMPGPLVQVHADRLYWTYLDRDLMEIRTIDPTVTLSGDF